MLQNPMSESSQLGAIAELPGAVNAIVGTQDGELRAEFGAVGDSDALAASAAVVTCELLGLGALLRLGELTTTSVKAASAGRVFARRGSAVLAVAVDAKASLGAIEARLREVPWAEPPAVEPPSVNRVSTVKTLARVRGSTLAPAPIISMPAPPRAMPVPRAVGAEPRPPSSTGVSASMKALATGQVFAGDLDEFSVPDLLELLRNSQRSGLLICTTVAGTGTVQLARGQIVFADSPAALDIREQLLSVTGMPAEQHAALESAPPAWFDHTTSCCELVSRNVVSLDVVERACVARIYSALREMIGWTSGRFSFDPTVAAPASAPRALNTQTVLMRLFQEPDRSK